ncbi:MAG: hypothetical protein JO250_20665 [Armatimonadetes bacterium]|nr:hypothetical protein [Armatimonadota bacterium]
MRQKMIQPLIPEMVQPGARTLVDEYAIYARLPEWGYEHGSLYHARRWDAAMRTARLLPGACQHS